MKKHIAFIACFTALLFNCCAGGGSSDEVVTIKTPYGEMVVILFDETPKHKENFLKLVREKYYDSTLFHRVIEGFMIQGGDPESKKAAPGQHLGSGGPGYTIPAEFNPKLYHEKGALAAARLGDQQNPQKESSGSQFYIVDGNIIPEAQMKIDQHSMGQAMDQMFQTRMYTPFFDSLSNLYNSKDMDGYMDLIVKSIPRIEKATGLKVTTDVSPDKLKAYSTVGGTPMLDGQYTVFGKVIKGLDVIDKIAAVEKDYSDRPVENVWMTMSVEKMSKKKIEKEYGYTYPAASK